VKFRQKVNHILSGISSQYSLLPILHLNFTIYPQIFYLKTCSKAVHSV